MKRRVTIYRDEGGLKSLFDRRKYDVIVSEDSVVNINYSPDMKIRVSGEKGTPISDRAQANLYEVIRKVSEGYGIPKIRFADRTTKTELEALATALNRDLKGDFAKADEYWRNAA